ncbi:alpha/beta fold hydrolase [Spirosoma fluviale]|uniref:Pimeloyl-ACP methyl ester carboxylesterase n=1 Tax=Spirosoma fluviale TaxID=1597977 RepID=A0A286GM80_9BACT|nr:alpha/beta hydrolase [Spirosoma fluviale]SOD96602.1 Pimeloyl-ACP methyl ester carboxylesterase [Spirosoma fluviale]
MKYATNGVNLNVLEQGLGASLPLVFLHYFGGSAVEWEIVMNLLERDYRCVAIDLRGHGNSEAPKTGYAVDDMADDVLGLIDLFGLQDYVLVAHSMSGKVALAVAARQPAGLQALVLVSPSPPVPEPIPDDEREKLLTGHGKRSSAEKTLKNITEAPVSEAVREQIIADDLRTAKPAWDAWLLAGSKEDISERMADINVPVHIIVGTEDRALPPDVQTRLVLPYLKNASFDTVENAGHLLPWEIPDQLATFIQKKIG